MSASIQSQIVAAAVLQLAAAGAAMTPPVNAHRARVESFPASQLPAWNVIPEDCELDLANSYSGASAWRFRFCVRCMVSAQNEVDSAADPLFVTAVSAILADLTLGGLVNATRMLSQKWEKDGPAATDNLALVLTFETEYATARNNPTAPMP